SDLAAPQKASKTTRRPAFWIAFKSMTSRSRERYVPRGSRASEAGARAGFGWSFTASAISASIVLVTSGRAGAPSGVENLIPLYFGDVWEAGKFIAPS